MVTTPILMFEINVLRDNLSDYQLFTLYCAKIGGQLDSSKRHGRLFAIIFRDSKCAKAQKIRYEMYPELKPNVYPDQLELEFCRLEQDWVNDQAKYLRDVDYLLTKATVFTPLEELQVS